MSDQLLFCAATRFDAARQLKAVPARHRARQVHGHGFVVTVRAEACGADDRPTSLRERLNAVAARLDYQSLNGRLEEPSDENLAGWFERHLELPRVHSITVQSTPDRGAERDRRGRLRVWRRYPLQAAHQLPHVPPRHKCSRMHGHGFQVALCGDYGEEPPPSALVYDRLDEAWAPLHVMLNHACLNDIEGLENPTSEIIAGWIWNRLNSELPELSSVLVHETASCGARFDGSRYWIWKDAMFDSARRAPAGIGAQGRRGITGHTYLLRLHLQAPLDPIMGWALDFGEVKDSFSPVFLELDHRLLDEVVGQACDVTTVASWIRRRMTDVLPQLRRIDLYETPGCGAVLCWGEEDTTLALP
jgi:6-pyruvoyltetrahydropterin/6-carboxytetrahydropterin synthase